MLWHRLRGVSPVIALALLMSSLPGEALELSDVLFYSPMDGSVTPAIATGGGASTTKGQAVFVPGKRGQAVVCGDSALHLAYPIAGNLRREQGSLSVWLSPQNWRSGDGKHHMFLVVQGEPATLLYTFLSLDTKYLQLQGANPNVSADVLWKPGEWQNLVITWQEGEFCLYVDGNLTSANTETMSLVGKLGQSLLVGSDYWGTQDSTAVDELTIFKRALIPEEVKALHRWADQPSADGPAPSFRDAPALRVALRHFPSAGRVQITARATGVGMGEIDRAHAAAQLQDAKRNALAEKPLELEVGKPSTTEFDVSNLKPGTYRVRVVMILHRKPFDAQELTFERKEKPAWLGNRIAAEDEVPIPWTPVKVIGNAGNRATSQRKEGVAQGPSYPITLSCWGREYAFDGLLCGQVTTQGVPLLAAPMQLHLVQEGRPAVAAMGEARIIEQRKQAVVLASSGKLGDLTVRSRARFEFDGFAWFEVELVPPAQGAGVDSLSFEMPFATQQAALFYSGIYYPSLDNGTGAVKPEGFKGGWRNWFWVGEERGGVEWFAENNRGYVLSKPGEGLSITPGPRQTMVRINIIDTSTRLTSPLKIAFGIQATPVRPRRADWRLWRALPHQTEGVDPGLYTLPAGGRMRGFTLWNTNWCQVLNFPDPNPGAREWLAAQENKRLRPCLYLALTTTDPREAEFRYFWEDWRVTPGTPYLPQWLESKEYWTETSICPASGWKDYFLWLLDKAINKADIKGLYFDNSIPGLCANPYHGCGEPGPEGKLTGTVPLLAARDWFKRVYILMKRHDPASLVTIHMSGFPLMPLQSFSEVIIDGENFGGYMKVMKAEKGWDDYTHALPLDVMRAQYRNHWGPDTAFLPEFHSVWGADWFKATPQRLASVEHLIGLLLIHDSGLWPAWSNVEPYGRLFKAEDRFGWDESVTFVPYWNLGGRANVDADGKQPVVLSLFLRPGKVMFLPMNNTDEDLTVRLSWEAGKVGLAGKTFVALEDYFHGGRFAVNGNSALIPLARHNFRMLVPVLR